MPVYVRELLADARFAAIPTNYFVFGDGGAPQPKKSWGRSFAWRRMRRCLVALVEAGKLGDVEGISPYSFKDTGITEWLRLLPLPQVMQQAGHTNPGTTMLYNQPDLINEGFAGLKTRIDSI
jgi:integrase